MFNVSAVIAAYLIGSLSFAVIVSKYYGMDDPRTYGSGNPGATNVLRSGKKKAAALTLLGDALKGLVAVVLARCLQDALTLSDITIAVVAVAALVGHMWPLFFGFKVSSLAALAATVAAPLVAFWLMPYSSWAWATVVIAVLVLYRHKSNIQNLLQGKEGKIGDKADKP